MKKLLQKYILFIQICFFSFNILSAQIANIESERIITDTTGWAGNIKIGLVITKDVNAVIQAVSEAHLQFKTVKSLFLLKASTNFTKAGGTTFVANNFLHLRHNYKLNSWLRWEEFTQLQNNKITGIDLRYLLGTGPRFKLYQSKSLALYLGNSIMYEYEREMDNENKQIINEHPRSSNYISLTYKPIDNLKIVHTSYFQTLFDFPDDHRINTQTDIEFKIYKKLSYTLSYKLLYDSKPAFKAPNTTYSFENYISWEF